MLDILKTLIELLQTLFGKKQTTTTESKQETVSKTETVTPVVTPAVEETKEEETVVTENDNKKEEVTMETSELDEKKNRFIILIDNGHGTDTAGKRSPYSACGTEPAIEFYEYKWNREIAQPLVERLKKLGWKAELVVPETNDVSLATRVKRINQVCTNNGAANVVMVSVHANAAGNGSSWYTARGWSAFTTKGTTKSDKLAEYLYDAAEKNFPGMKIRKDTSDGDRDWESNFYIIKNANCAAVLTENFFYDNVEDVKYILSDEGKENVIKTHIEGITNYIKSL